MGFRLVQKSMTLNDLEHSKHIMQSLTGDQKVITYFQSVAGFESRGHDTAWLFLRYMTVFGG